MSFWGHLWRKGLVANVSHTRTIELTKIKACFTFQAAKIDQQMKASSVVQQPNPGAAAQYAVAAGGGAPGAAQFGGAPAQQQYSYAAASAQAAGQHFGGQFMGWKSENTRRPPGSRIWPLRKAPLSIFSMLFVSLSSFLSSFPALVTLISSNLSIHNLFFLVINSRFLHLSPSLSLTLDPSLTCFVSEFICIDELEDQWKQLAGDS